MITVHHLNNSRSQRVLWLLEELELPYEVKRYERDAKTMLAPPALRAIHPLGKSPVITDGGKTIAESGAIMEYLISYYGNGRLVPPERTPERDRYNYWLHYAEGSAMPPLVMRLIFSYMPRAPMPFFMRPVVRAVANGTIKSYVDPQIKLQLDFVNRELGDHAWFAGPEFTAADVQMSFITEVAASRAAGFTQTYPQIAKFVERIHARPAYQRALERGGPYSILS